MIASTVGPVAPMRATSKTATNTAGASSIAHRDRSAAPATHPTASPSAIVASACGAVTGQCGVHHPATSPATTAATTLRAMPRRRAVHTASAMRVRRGPVPASMDAVAGVVSRASRTCTPSLTMAHLLLAVSTVTSHCRRPPTVLPCLPRGTSQDLRPTTWGSGHRPRARCGRNSGRDRRGVRLCRRDPGATTWGRVTAEGRTPMLFHRVPRRSRTAAAG